jgi:hypothetical protein
MAVPTLHVGVKLALRTHVLVTQSSEFTCLRNWQGMQEIGITEKKVMWYPKNAFSLHERLLLQYKIGNQLE